jgi:hypothetical protein
VQRTLVKVSAHPVEFGHSFHASWYPGSPA